MKYIALISTLAVAVIIGCSSPAAPDFNSDVIYDQEVSRGWGYFSSGEYALASTSFRLAMSADVSGQFADALIGLGWSLARQDSLSAAVSRFNTAMQRSPASPEPLIFALSGLSLGYRDITPSNDALVRDNALSTLELDSNFVFRYDTSVNYSDIEAVLAEAYFNLGSYAEAAAIVDPNGTLDSQSDTYQEDLLALINQKIETSRGGQ